MVNSEYNNERIGKMFASSKKQFNGAATSQGELNQALLKAAQSGDADLVRTTLEAGANPNATDDYKWTALHLAAHGGHDDTVRTLLLAGSNITARTNLGNRAEDLARKTKNISTEKILKNYDRRLEALLLRRKAAPPAKGGRPRS